MRHTSLIAALSVALLCAPAMSMDMARVSNVYVADFKSEEPQRCRPSDVALSHRQARDFFVRARQVGTRSLHDHYEQAPCYIEGTLRYRARSCAWEIRAGATGH